MAGVLGRRKSIEDAIATTEERESRLKKDLGALDIIVFGIGVIVGAGIFVLTGEAAATEAGPGVALSFVFAAIVSALAALCYAEFAAMVPVAGSAYTFSYVTLGQFIAFVIGWDLALEFVVGASAVAVGASGYLSSVLDELFGFTLPEAISAGPLDGGVINLPAILVVAFVTLLLVRGIKITARANLIIVLLTIAVLLLIIVVGGTEVNTGNWTPFLPFGWEGVLGGAAIVFFAFIGFDVVATTAEEARNPQRDMPLGVIGSLAITALLYVAVTLVITGMVPFRDLAGAAPIADAFTAVDRPYVAVFIFAGALIALLNTVLILLLGQTRVAFAMARDRLFPRALARTHPTYGTPYRLTLITGTLIAILAGLVPIADLANLVSIGTLFAFILVAAGVLYLRRADPDRRRPFRVPFSPFVPIASIILSLVLMATLDTATWIRFLVWLAIGLVVYFAYSRKRADPTAG